MEPSSSVPALDGLVLEAVEWLPSGADAGLLRVRGRWSDVGRREAELPALGVRRAAEARRFESLPDARFGRDPAIWRATFLVPAALIEPEPDELWLSWESGARAGLPAPVAARGFDPPPAANLQPPPDPGGEVIDRAVMAERRARRAEAAERTHAERAAQALKALEVLELRSAELERRLGALQATPSPEAEAAPLEAVPADRAPLAAGAPAASGPGEAALTAAVTTVKRLRGELDEQRQRLRKSELMRAADTVALASLRDDEGRARALQAQLATAELALAEARAAADARAADVVAAREQAAEQVAAAHRRAAVDAAAVRSRAAEELDAAERVLALERERTAAAGAASAEARSELEIAGRDLVDERAAHAGTRKLLATRDEELAAIGEELAGVRAELAAVRQDAAERAELLDRRLSELETTLGEERRVHALAATELETARARLAGAEAARRAESVARAALDEAIDHERLARATLADALDAARVDLTRLQTTQADLVLTREEARTAAVAARERAVLAEAELARVRDEAASAQAELARAREEAAFAGAAAQADIGRMREEAASAEQAAHAEIARVHEGAASAEQAAQAEIARVREEAAAGEQAARAEIARVREEAAAAEQAVQAEIARVREEAAAGAQAAQTDLAAVRRQAVAAEAASRASAAAAADGLMAARAEAAEARAAAQRSDAERQATRGELEAALARIAERELASGRGPLTSAEREAGDVLARIIELERAPDADLGPRAREQAEAAAAAPRAVDAERRTLAADLDAAAAALRARVDEPLPTAAPVAAAAASAGELPDAGPAVRAPPVSPPARRRIITETHQPPRADVIGTSAREYPWLRGALVKLAHDDPPAAARLLLGLMPAQHALVTAPLDYDLTIRGTGTYAVTVTDGSATAAPIEAPRPRSIAAFHVAADVVTFAELLAGVHKRIGRWWAPVRLHGRRGEAVALRDALAASDLSLSASVRAGAQLDPDLVFRAFAYAIQPAWTRGHRFTIAQELTDPQPLRWHIVVRDGAPLAIERRAPSQAPDAVVSMSRAALDHLLRDEPVPRGERPAIRGDRVAVAALKAWTDRAQGR